MPLIPAPGWLSADPFTSKSVHCRHQHKIDRDEFQIMLSQHNPTWKAFTDQLERTGEKLRTNPDGDVRSPPLDASHLISAQTLQYVGRAGSHGLAHISDPTMSYLFNRRQD